MNIEHKFKEIQKIKGEINPKMKSDVSRLILLQIMWVCEEEKNHNIETKIIKMV